MTPSPNPLLTLTLSSLLCFLLTRTHAQTCYLPNHTPAPLDHPCGGPTALCCPLNWHCLANNLCLEPATNHTERRTCTDPTFSAAGCPDFCTYSAEGNEAIAQCDNGRYCCDGNGSIDCCHNPRKLPGGDGVFRFGGAGGGGGDRDGWGRGAE